MSTLDNISLYNICVKLTLSEFKENLKRAGKIARDNLRLNADESTRLRFELEDFFNRSNQDAIIEETLQNEISNHIRTKKRGSE